MVLVQAPAEVQRDRLALRRTRQYVNRLMQWNRAAHLMFQTRRAAMNGRDLSATNSHARICINPIRVWTRLFTPALLDQLRNSSAAPASVVVYADGESIAAAALDLEQQAVLNELTDYQPCTLAQWAAVSHAADRAELADRCNLLVELGLAAVY